MARTFEEIHKGQPSTGAVHVMSTGQRRRARTYSQVIAEATRGVDAGMAPPSGGQMNQPGPTADERQDADWRGHYLGRGAGAQLSTGFNQNGNGIGKGADDEDEEAEVQRKFEVAISKLDEDQNLVFGWAQVIEEDGQVITDTQGDEVSEADLEKAFYYFAKDGRETDEMHTDNVRGRMIECMVFTKAKQRALGINLGKIGAWVGFELDPEVFAKVKSGEYPAFSIGGTGRRVPLG